MLIFCVSSVLCSSVSLLSGCKDTNHNRSWDNAIQYDLIVTWCIKAGIDPTSKSDHIHRQLQCPFFLEGGHNSTPNRCLLE
jgi:hypothetical protein